MAESVFGVFEDEAQDSSPLQEKLISILASSEIEPDTSPNLIRVGDPNQAINSTFTPADPMYFNWFCTTCDLQGNLATMDWAGRSNQIIIRAANFVFEWVNQREKTAEISQLELPFRPQAIQAVDSGDPQPEANPPAAGRGLELYYPDDIYHTVELIVKE